MLLHGHFLLVTVEVGLARVKRLRDEEAIERPDQEEFVSRSDEVALGIALVAAEQIGVDVGGTPSRRW